MPNYLEIGRAIVREVEQITQLFDAAYGARGAAKAVEAVKVPGEFETRIIGYLDTLGIKTNNARNIKVGDDGVITGSFSLNNRAGVLFDKLQTWERQGGFSSGELPTQLPSLLKKYTGHAWLEGNNRSKSWVPTLVAEDGLVSRQLGINEIELLKKGDFSALQKELADGVKPQHLHLSGVGENLSIYSQQNRLHEWTPGDRINTVERWVEPSVPVQLESLRQEVLVPMSPEHLRQLANRANIHDVAISALLSKAGRAI